MNKLVKNYIYNILYHIFLIVVPLATAPYLARVISPACMSDYTYINSVTSVISTFGLLGLNSYGYRQIAYDRDDREKVCKTFSEIFTLRLILALIVSAIYIPIVLTLENSLYYMIQYVLILSLFIDVSWVFIGFEDLGAVTFKNFVAKLLTVIGIFLFVKSDDDLWIYFALFAFTTFITMVSIYFPLRKYVSFKRIKAKETFVHIWDSIKLFIPQVATTLYLQVDKIMLKHLSASNEAAAHYDYAEKIITMPLTLITALGVVMMPRLANLHATEGKKDEISYYLNKTIRFSLFSSLPMAFGLAAISLDFIPWYLGENYSPSAIALIILCPIILLNALSNIFGSQYLTAVNKTGVLTVAYYGGAAINLILNYLLIPKYGCIGAAVATIACSAVSFLIQYIFVRRDVRLSGNLSAFAKYTVCSLIMFASVFVIGYYLPSTAVTTVIQCTVGVIIYVVCMLILKDEMIFFAINKAKGMLFKKK